MEHGGAIVAKGGAEVQSAFQMLVIRRAGCDRDGRICDETLRHARA